MKLNSFSEQDKINLRSNMCEACELSWRINGYKKTSISHLTSAVNISTGAFYSLYKTKEDVFLDTLLRIRQRLKENIQQILDENPNKLGLINSMEWIYEEYRKSQFLYDFTNPDFQSFYQKLSEEDLSEIKESSIEYTDMIITKANLNLKCDRDLAYTILNSLLYTVSMHTEKEELQIEAFSTLVNIVVEDIFEDVRK